MFSIFLLGFCVVANAQQYIDLKSLKASNQPNTILATGNGSIYLSATSDLTTILDTIIFTSNGMTKSATDLLNTRLFQNSDLIQPWIVQGPVTVSTSASADQISSLTGSIFLTTAKQATDTNFLVYDLKTEQTISTNAPQSTIVILNSQYAAVPYVSSTISEWKQSMNQQVFLYRGVPDDNAEVANSAIFANPFNTSDLSVQMTSVETFSLSLPIYYMRIYGGVSFKISRKYTNIGGNQFSNSLTTGFYMKSQTAGNVDLSLRPLTAQTSNMLGVNYIGNVPASGSVTVGVTLANGVSVQNQFSTAATQSMGWETNVGSPFTIKSTGAVGSEFYIQYYVRSGQSTTQSPATDSPYKGTTPRPVVTTTSSAGALQVTLSMICSYFGYRLMQ
ncbi:unnamed protein product [Caenorhabditis angaria]|uniref:Uncharacterized protein n=1 Tax=Caenorhabditis angaria TaxID=860376 RepID=A0A9P1IXC6_9PELO|nr:unnamed protein product [Caenorhabditis angaria]